MTAEIKTMIGQLNIAGGVWRNDVPNQVAVREPKSADAPGAGKGDLFVLTEVRGSAANLKSLEQQLAQTIRDAYYMARGPVTPSLRRALQAANDQLYRHNQKVTPDMKIVAGAVVLIMREDEAFVAQIGPTALFAVLNDLIRRYPAQSSWLNKTPHPQDPALGINVFVEPNLHHLHVTPGDMLILSDSRLASRLSLDDVVKAVMVRNVKATIKNLGRAVQATDCSALVLAAIEVEQSALATIKRNAASPLSRFLDRTPNPTHTPHPRVAPPRKPNALADSIAEPQPSLEQALVEVPPSKTSQRDTMRQKLPQWLGRYPKNPGEDEPSRIAEPSPIQPTHDQPAAMPKEQLRHQAFKPSEVDDEPEQHEKRRAKIMASVAHDPGFHPKLDQQDQSTAGSISVGRILRWVSAGLLLLIALLGYGLKTILGLVLPNTNSHAPRRAGVHAYQAQTSPVSWILLRNMVIAIPVVVGLIVGISYLQKGRIREAEYQEFITNAQNKFQQAQAVTADPAAALGLMAEAEFALAEAENIKGTQPEIIELRQQMSETSDSIGKVERLFYMPQLRQYTETGTNLKRIVVQGVELYILDAGTDRIYHHRLDDVGEALLPDDESLFLATKGQQVEHISVGELLDMTWMPTGGNRQTSDLVILNSTGLLEYNPNWGITTSTLASSELLSLPVAVSSFFGNFYILDPQANRLLRYLPTADGYSAAPENYFPADQPIDLTNAVGFAIDGAIYVLFADGRIAKYESGRPVEFNLTGLDKPLSNPVSIFTAPDEEVQYVYVADAGNQRVVQLEKDGRFVRQFKPRAGEAVSFANLQDIYVDEIGSRIYILDSNNLYVTNLPGEAAAE